MDIRLLRYVLAVYECRSFTQAARQLHIAQPSLSQQVAKLEDELGIRLFHRGQGPVRPTVDGEFFVQEARQIAQRVDNLALQLHERTHGMGTQLTVGSTAATGAHILPRALKAFKAEHPKVQTSLVEESTSELTQLAVDGRVDVAILSLPINEDGLAVEPLLTEDLYLALPNASQQWFPDDDETVALSALKDAPFVVLKEGYGFRRTVLQLCAAAGFEPRIAFETSSIDVAQSIVAYGMGVTLVPRMVLRSPNEGQSGANDDVPHYVALDGGPTRTLVFAYPKSRHLSLAARTFIGLTQGLKWPSHSSCQPETNGR